MNQLTIEDIPGIASEYNGLIRQKQSLLVDGSVLTTKDIIDVSLRKRSVELSTSDAFCQKLAASVDLVAQAVKEEKTIYGITTNFGGNAKGSIQRAETWALQRSLILGLKCGVGEDLPDCVVRAAMLIRANTLAKGASGIRREILERILVFLNNDIVPRVKDLGSLGASGDLIPLAYIAGAVAGISSDFLVNHLGKPTDCMSALAAVGLEPLELGPKEGIALVNGTSVLGAIAVHEVDNFELALNLTLAINAMYCEAMLAASDSFDSMVHSLKPHVGQGDVARTMRHLLDGSKIIRERERQPLDLVQDRYSVRCIPQYFGPILEGIRQIKSHVETEVNSVDDNPIVDVEGGRFLQAGNFYGQYVALGMDQLRLYIALCCKQLDTQIALLVTPEFSRGLPASLCNGKGQVKFGLKGLQICGNSLLPRLLHLGNPIVSLYPTHAEQYNQNVNSQGFNAAALAAESNRIFFEYLGIACIFAAQSLELRCAQLFSSYEVGAYASRWTALLYAAIVEVAGCGVAREGSLLVSDQGPRIDTMLARLVADLKLDGGKIAAAIAASNANENAHG